MTSFSSTPRPVFIYSAADDTWYEVSAKADTASGYEWGGDHSFLSFITARYGINNFLNPAARDAAITSPQRGAFCILKQDALGNNINTLQVYTGSEWTDMVPSPINNGGKFLKSDGIISKWEEVPEVLPQIFFMMGA